MKVITSTLFARTPQFLTLAEKRALMLTCALANDAGYAEVAATDYAENYGVAPATAYAQLRESSMALLSALWVRKATPAERGAKADVTVRHWVSEGDYWHGQGRAALRLSDALMAETGFQSSGSFICYDLQAVAGLNSVYSWRMFEYLLTWYGSGKVTASVDYLRDLLHAPASSRRTVKAFVAKILKPAMSELSKTGMDATFTPVRQGRATIAFEFSIKGVNTPKGTRTKNGRLPVLPPVQAITPAPVTESCPPASSACENSPVPPASPKIEKTVAGIDLEAASAHVEAVYTMVAQAKPAELKALGLDKAAASKLVFRTIRKQGLAAILAIKPELGVAQLALLSACEAPRIVAERDAFLMDY